MSKAQRIFLFLFIGAKNALYSAIEVMFQNFLNYLSVTVISNLLFVSTYTRNFILKKFNNIYYLSTGFTSEKHWYSILKKSTHDLIEVFFNEKFFDPVFFSYHFDYDENCSALLREFTRHLSLFSVSMHFLRCIRSYDKVIGSPSYCKLCSRVRDFDFKCKDLF